MDYDPRGEFGHLDQPAEPRQQPAPLTFGSVFWACLLALCVWSVLAYAVASALIEQASSDF